MIELTRTSKTAFTIHKVGGSYWSNVTASLKISDLSHIAGKLELSYEDMGKAATIISCADNRHADLCDICEELGVEFVDTYNAR